MKISIGVVIYWAVIVLWSLRILGNLFSYIHLWFVKEYRWDRMRIHLHTQQGKLIWFIPFKRPPISPKTILLFGSMIITIAILYISLPFYPFIRLFIIDVLLFPISSVYVLIYHIPTKIYHGIQIRRATQKIRNHQPMTVIGITGSYGKTSTKEYLAAILGTRYRVLKTEASKNSVIGVAEVILHDLKPDHEVFIVEMGAYKRGEIAEIAGMVKPEIGILTAINAQHQDLFGTMETTMQAKYELISGLRGKRIAIINGDNAYTEKMSVRARRDGCTVWLYSKAADPNKKSEFTASDVRSGFSGISFQMRHGKQDVAVASRVIGEHSVSNILASIAAAVAVGMSFDEAAKAASSSIVPFSKTLEMTPGINGSIYINDTFNNNPDAAIAALDVLAQSKGKKILVFQPMIELGSYSRDGHVAVGRAAAKICDEIFLTNSNFLEYMCEGIRTIVKEKKPKIMSPKETATMIRSILQKGDAVLFKGKEAEFSLKALRSLG